MSLYYSCDYQRDTSNSENLYPKWEELFPKRYKIYQGFLKHSFMLNLAHFEFEHLQYFFL